MPWRRSLLNLPGMHIEKVEGHGQAVAQPSTKNIICLGFKKLPADLLDSQGQRQADHVAFRTNIFPNIGRTDWHS